MALDLPILGEVKIPALIVAFLAARRSDADYPIPAANVLGLVAGPVKETVSRSHASLEVWVPSFEMMERRDNPMFTVWLDLHVGPDSTVAQDMEKLGLVRRAFAGGPLPGGANATNSSTNPFLAYLNGLTSGEKAGWELWSFSMVGGSIEVDDDRRVVYRTEARCGMRSYASTV